MVIDNARRDAGAVAAPAAGDGPGAAPLPGRPALPAAPPAAGAGPPGGLRDRGEVWFTTPGAHLRAHGRARGGARGRRSREPARCGGHGAGRAALAAEIGRRPVRATRPARASRRRHLRLDVRERHAAAAARPAPSCRRSRCARCSASAARWCARCCSDWLTTTSCELRPNSGAVVAVPTARGDAADLRGPPRDRGGDRAGWRRSTPAPPTWPPCAASWPASTRPCTASTSRRGPAGERLPPARRRRCRATRSWSVTWRRWSRAAR